MKLERLFTYEDLMTRYGVCKNSIRVWFGHIHRFKVTLRTVRIKEREVVKFERLTTAQRRALIQRNKALSCHGKKRTRAR